MSKELQDWKFKHGCIQYLLVDSQEELDAERNATLAGLNRLLKVANLPFQKIVMLDELIVDWEARSQGLGTKALQEFCHEFNDYIIVLEAGVLMSEYPDIDEMSNQDALSIINRLCDFYEHRGFVDINRFTGMYDKLEHLACSYIFENAASSQILSYCRSEVKSF